MPRHPVDEPFTRGNDTAEHALYGVGPASDYGVPIGTPVFPIFPVVRLERLGSRSAAGGFELRGHAANGDWWSEQHLSAYVSRTSAGELDQVAWSGNTGTNTQGPHVHAFVVIGGVRMSVWEYLTMLAATDAKPIEPQGKGDAMSQVYIKVAVDSGPAKDSQFVLGLKPGVISITGKEEWFVDAVNAILDGFASHSDKLVQVDISGQAYQGGVLSVFEVDPVVVQKDASIDVDAEAIATKTADVIDDRARARLGS